MTHALLPNILLVDDKPNNLLALKDILEDVEADLLLAHSGNEALTFMTQHEFALVLLDVQMPEMDGIEVATLMRQVDATKHIPIIFVTAYGQSTDMTFKGYEVGAVDYLLKPINSQALRSKVQVFLDLFRQKQDLRHLVDEQKRIAAKLMKSRDEALEAVRSKSAFLATMSHELRTPMNGILGMADILLESLLNADQRDCVETVKYSADALLTILNDILDFSKIESGKLQIEVIDFDLRLVVDEVMDLLGAKAQDKGLELVGLVDASVPRAVRGDPGRLRQILLNLVGNAIKFTEHGEVVVHVSLETETVDAVQLRVDVSDTGIGLEADAQEKLFQPFTQADSTTTRQFGGTGLGLSICKQLVELMGGTIRVDSQAGHGSRFWFTISLEKQANPGVIEQEAEQSLDDIRVCVVADNTNTRLLLNHYLKAWGMICLDAENGSMALKVLKEASAEGRACDLLILDKHLSDMDGLQLAEHVRVEPDLSRLQLVMLTSTGQRGDAAIAREAGIAAYVTKPIHHDRLRKCLSLMLSGSFSADPQIITQSTVHETTPREEGYVLVAEDNLVNQKVVVRMLKKLNYRVDVVLNGREAVEAVSTVSYDAVLMDCQMPEMDGLEATKKIREMEGEKRKAIGARREAKKDPSPHPLLLTPHESLCRIPIIALTANAMKGDRERCLEVGMDDFISKPTTLETLETMLAQWVGKTAREKVVMENQQ